MSSHVLSGIQSRAEGKRECKRLDEDNTYFSTMFKINLGYWQEIILGSLC